MANQYDFTDETKKRIWQELMRRWPQLTCPLCHSVQWELANGIAAVPLMSNYWLGQTSSHLPNAALICGTCGHTMFFNLLAMGLQEVVGPDPEKWKEEQMKKAGLRYG